MAAITLAEAQEDLTLARAAWQTALKNRKFDHTGSQVQFLSENHEIDKLRKSYDICIEIVEDLTPGNQGLIVSQIAPQ